MATGPSWQTVAAVRERDGHGCVRCGRQSGLSTQHRVARGMGGSRRTARPWINLPSNLLTLCGTGTTGCHGWVESHPEESRRNGWAMYRVGTLLIPEDVPVLYRDGWFYLDDEGNRHRAGRYAGSGGGRGRETGDDPVLAAPWAPVPDWP